MMTVSGYKYHCNSIISLKTLSTSEEKTRFIMFNLCQCNDTLHTALVPNLFAPCTLLSHVRMSFPPVQDSLTKKLMVNDNVNYAIKLPTIND